MFTLSPPSIRCRKACTFNIGYILSCCSWRDECNLMGVIDWKNVGYYRYMFKPLIPIFIVTVHSNQGVDTIILGILQGV